MKKPMKIAIIIAAVILGLAIPPGIFFVHILLQGLNCGMFSYHPEAAVKGCSLFTEEIAKKDTVEDFDTESRMVLWLHLAHVHAGQDDQKEFEVNSAPYMRDTWPAPLLKLFLGKMTVEEVYAASKLESPIPRNDQDCEAHYYAGEWYQEQKQPEEAEKAFAAAKELCLPDTIEQGNLSQYSLARTLLALTGH